MKASDSPRPGVALVSGATGGIGPDICRALAMHGMAVVIGGHPATRDQAEALLDELSEAGFVASLALADLVDAIAVRHSIDEAAETLGGIDAVVCAAATSVSAQRPWRSFTPDEWERTLTVNVVGTAVTIEASYDYLLRSANPSIVVFSSVTPLLGRTGNLPYVTSKAALMGMTRSLARECGVDGVRVNAIAPGAIMTSDEAVYGTPEDLEGLLFPLQALKRRGVPADVASAVRFLVSGESAFITGQVLVVDGGWVMP